MFAMSHTKRLFSGAVRTLFATFRHWPFVLYKFAKYIAKYIKIIPRGEGPGSVQWPVRAASHVPLSTVVKVLNRYSFIYHKGLGNTLFPFYLGHSYFQRYNVECRLTMSRAGRGTFYLCFSRGDFDQQKLTQKHIRSTHTHFDRPQI